MIYDFFAIPVRLDFFLNQILLIISSIVMVVACIRISFSKNLLESVIIMSVFSLFIGISYLFMDAPDVAMTETALGACLSTCVLINIVKIVGPNAGLLQKPRVISAVILCLILAIALVYASLDLPDFGSSDSPLQKHVSKYYIENTHNDIAIPSMVAAILASYRGYDTLGETSVILIAGIAVMLILSRRKKVNA